MSEILGKIVTGALTAIVTLTVCLINNAVQIRKDRLDREQAQNTQLEVLKREMTKQMGEISSDFMAHLQELLATQQDITSKIQLFSYQLETLSKSVETQNQVHSQIVERVYSLEKRMDVAEEKQRVANNRIDDLEDENKRKQN